MARGQQFPFRIQIKNWSTIQKHMQINAYFDNPAVYIILAFPVVTKPIYEVIRVTPLPVHDQNYMFALLKITHTLLAIDKENNQYLTLKEDDLNKCVQDDKNYIYERNYPAYSVTANAPCEVQVYAKSVGYLNHCERQHIVSNMTLWITLAETQAWLYSIAAEQKIIQCNEQKEKQLTITKTGKLTLNENCKLTTLDMTLRTKKLIGTRYIQMHLPEFNLTLTKEHKEFDTKIKLRQDTIFEQVIKDPAEIDKLSLSLEELNKEIENSESNIFAKYKHAIYHIGSSTITIIRIIVIGISVWKIKCKKHTAPATVCTQ